MLRMVAALLVDEEMRWLLWAWLGEQLPVIRF
jgi:hypothetical protein